MAGGTAGPTQGVGLQKSKWNNNVLPTHKRVLGTVMNTLSSLLARFEREGDRDVKIVEEAIMAVEEIEECLKGNGNIGVLTNIQREVQDIKRMVAEKEKREGMQQGAVGGHSWAKVAAFTSSPNDDKKMRVRMETTAQTPADMVRELKQGPFKAAYAVRPLPSGNIDIYFPSEQLRNQAQAMPNPEGIRILQREHLVELMGVPRSLEVRRGRGADNSRLI